MQPGLTRAVPMGIVGFILGALFVIVLRSLQNIEPIWDTQIGFVAGAFATAAGFVWGIGAFDPRMSQHAHAPEVDEFGLVIDDAHHDDIATDAKEENQPVRILGASMWQVIFWTIILALILMAVVAFPSGFVLQTSHDASAAVNEVGYETVKLPILGEEVQMSQLTMLVGFIIFTLVSLAVFAGGLGLVFIFISRGVTDAKASPAVPLGSEPDENRLSDTSLSLPILVGIYMVLLIVFFGLSHFILFDQVFPQTGWLRPWLASISASVMALVVVSAAASFFGRAMRRIGIYVALAALSYGVFYAALIGFVVPKPESLRVVLSLANAVIIPIGLVFPTLALHIVGKGAAWLARVLRGLPGFLGQK